MDAPRGTALVIALLVASVTVALPGPALAHGNTWVYEDETDLDSSEGLENVDVHPERTNLCEGIAGIPFKTDPQWVRVGGSPDPATPFVEVSGQLLPDLNGDTNPKITHTDNPANHYSKDVIPFVTLDPPYRGLLGTGNFVTGDEPEHGMLEVEWERGGVPLFAFPAAGDRTSVWGPHIWDCGHGGPNDFRTEIHAPVGWVLFRNTASLGDRDLPPPDDKRTQWPWIWYEATDRQGIGATLPTTGLGNTPVQATVADAFFSSFGGGVPESLNGCSDGGAFEPGFVDAPCMAVFPDALDWFQPVLAQDYSFFVPAPPKPTPDAEMLWEVEDRCGEIPVSPGNPPGPDIDRVGEADDTAAGIGPATCGIPDQVEVTEENGQPGIRATVKAATGGAEYPANRYVAFAKRYKVAWDFVPPPAQRVRTYSVGVTHLRVYDDAEPCGNDGEWIMGIRVNEAWIYPVHGRAEDGKPFWADEAIDDPKCEIGGGNYNQYRIRQRLTVSVVPGQPLNVWERSYDHDPVETSDINPVVNAFPQGPGTYERGTTNPDVSGAHTIGFVVRDVTRAYPSAGRPVVEGRWLRLVR